MKSDLVQELDFAKRQEEKRLSREADHKALESGLKSPAQLQRENAPFSKLRFEIDLDSVRALS